MARVIGCRPSLIGDCDGERKSIVEARETFSFYEGINTVLACST